jgi:hypothetical protein
MGCVVLQQRDDPVFWPVSVAGVVEREEEFEVELRGDGECVAEGVGVFVLSIAGIQREGVDMSGFCKRYV